MKYISAAVIPNFTLFIKRLYFAEMVWEIFCDQINFVCLSEAYFTFSHLHISHFHISHLGGRKKPACCPSGPLLQSSSCSVAKPTLCVGDLLGYYHLTGHADEDDADEDGEVEDDDEDNDDSDDDGGGFGDSTVKKEENVRRL